MLLYIWLVIVNFCDTGDRKRFNKIGESGQADLQSQADSAADFSGISELMEKFMEK